MEILNLATYQGKKSKVVLAHFKRTDNRGVNHYYVPDLRFIPEYSTNECLIFAATKEGGIKSYMDLYCNCNIPITEESIKNCIKEFCKELDEKESEPLREIII